MRGRAAELAEAVGRRPEQRGVSVADRKGVGVEAEASPEAKEAERADGAAAEVKDKEEASKEDFQWAQS